MTISQYHHRLRTIIMKHWHNHIYETIITIISCCTDCLPSSSLFSRCFHGAMGLSGSGVSTSSLSSWEERIQCVSFPEAAIRIFLSWVVFQIPAHFLLHRKQFEIQMNCLSFVCYSLRVTVTSRFTHDLQLLKLLHFTLSLHLSWWRWNHLLLHPRPAGKHCLMLVLVQTLLCFRSFSILGQVVAPQLEEKLRFCSV